jgi:hypothetical protein
LVRGVTYTEIADRSGYSKAAVGFMLDGSMRLRPTVVDAVAGLTDHRFAADIQDAARDAWIAKHPHVDPGTHLQPVREAVAG